MKKTALLLIVILAVMCAFVACDEPGQPAGPAAPAADIVVNDVKTMIAGITAVYQNENGDFIATHHSKFTVVDDDFTVNELVQLFFDKSYGVTALDPDSNGSTDELFLSYGAWPNITDVSLPNTGEMQWVVRDSSYQLVSDTTASVVDNAEYYYSYESIENPVPFTASDLSAVAPDDDKPYFYINTTSAKTVKITISAEKADKSIATMFAGTIQITDDDLTVEEVIKKVCDERGILYSISGGFINSIGEYANEFASAYAWWSSGFMVNGEEYVNYAGVNEVFVGDGAEIYVNYRYGTF